MMCAVNLEKRHATTFLAVVTEKTQCKFHSVKTDDSLLLSFYQIKAFFC